jgi:molybdopterin-guanine dinucleotide biosynthesis protein A
VAVTGVIQAGGRSTRMGGEPKALLEVGGKRIIERVVAAVGAVLHELLVVTNTPERYAFLGLPMVPDAFPEGGALGGIYTGVRAAAGGAAFTVACDMPFLHPALVRMVVERSGEADVVVPRTGTQLETLHALYGKACLRPMERCLRAGRLKVVGFFPEVRVLELDAAAMAPYRAPEVAFMNVNTPDELARARALAAALD